MLQVFTFRRKRLVSFLLIAPALAGILLVFGQKPALAANPAYINFQGKVVNADGTNVANNTYTFVFRLYDSSDHANIDTNCNSNSHCWWQETDSIVVTNGVFQVELGAGCALNTACTSSHSGINFNTNNALYLTLNFAGDSSGSYHGFMDPLIHLDTVPYAFNADQLGGISSSGFIQNGTSPQTSANFNIDGTGTAGTSFSAPSFTGAGVVTLSSGGSSILQLQSATGLVSLNKTGQTNAIRIYDSTPTNYTSITYGNISTNSGDLTVAAAGTTTIGNGTGAISITAGSGAALNLTGHATSTWQLDGASLLTVQGGTGGLTLNTLTTGVVTLDSGSTGAVNIGTGATGKTITIGNSQASTQVAITAGAITKTVSNTGVVISTTSNSATTLVVQNQSSNAVLSVDTSGGNITLGKVSAVTGNLIFDNSGSANTFTIKAGNTGGNIGFTLPTAITAGCLISDGSGVLSMQICGDTNVRTVTAAGACSPAWSKPTNALLVIVDAIGSGGGGGGGASQTSTTARTGGSGGGGGAHARAEFTAGDLGSTENCNVGTVGTHGNGGASGVSGTVGTSGGNTTFGTTTRLFAGGGGGGRQGVNSGVAGAGGSGGGTGAAGVVGTAAAQPGGGPGLTTGNAVNTTAAGGTGSGSSITTTIAPAEWGGAAGGGHTSTPANFAGGTSQYGGGGGGTGTGATSAPALIAGTAGGASMIYSLTGGGGGGVGTDGASPTKGTDGAAGSTAVAGSGGGGGGGTITANTNGAIGGQGGAPGGGGGGGGVGANTGLGGNGGDGAAGEVSIYTVRGQGADLAEVYCTNDKNLTAADTVAIDPSLKAGVKKTQSAYDKNAVGIISTNPGLTTGSTEEPCAKPVLVALSGRVPLHVSLQNGSIKQGDYLTSSSTPGVAMKATKSGQVIGQALTAYSDPSVPPYIVAFVEHGQFNGGSLADTLAQNDPTADPSQSIEQQALQYFMGWKQQAVDTTNVSEILTDRVAASMEIITPSVVADKVAVNTITPSSTGNVTLDLGKNGSLIVKNKDSGNSFSIDSTGNAQFGLSLNVLGNLEAQGKLTVNGDSLFGGNATFNKMAQFLGDVNVKGRLTFNSDSGGIAIIKKGATRVDIKFAKEYAQQPIVSAALVSDQVTLPDGTIEDIHLKEQRLFNVGYNYLISNVTTKGFTIVLSKSATEDIQFNWTSIAVNNPGTVTSDQSNQNPGSNQSPQTPAPTNQNSTTSGP